LKAYVATYLRVNQSSMRFLSIFKWQHFYRAENSIWKRRVSFN